MITTKTLLENETEKKDSMHEYTFSASQDNRVIDKLG
jgi:hypothetical protein